MAYKTSINTTEPAKYAMLVAQLNATYVPLFNISQTETSNTASFYLPDLAYVFNTSITSGDAILNDTNFVAITSKDLFVTPYNISMINPYVVAGPSTIQYS
jgi:hypothetical protein